MEFGTVRGDLVGLPAHFHDEHQLTFVLRGRRRFVVGGRPVVVEAGQAHWIPAGTPHLSLPDRDGVFCVNAYAAAGAYDVAGVLRDTGKLWGRGDRLRPVDLVAIVGWHWTGEATVDDPARVAGGPDRRSVAELASESGMSREAFTRKFTALHGMPPAAYERMLRLNRARDLLRAGAEIAPVAIDAGFADQSHLGRWFRRVFGVTPGLYRHR